MFLDQRFKGLCLFALFSMLSFMTLAALANDDFTSDFQTGNRFIVLKNGESYMSVDLNDYLTTGEAVLRRRQSELRPLSPDRKHVPLLIRAGRNAVDIMLIDIQDKTVRRQKLYRGIYFHPAKLTWVTPDRMVIEQEMPLGKHVLYDIGGNISKLLVAEEFLVWDDGGQNHASVFGKWEWFAERVAPHDVVPEKLIVSEALRYNSYWVYPTPLEGFVTRNEHRKWDSDISVREHGKGEEQPPVIRTRGVAISRNHILSTPVFLGDRTWIGFFEQVYPLNKYNEVIESNAVLLDAHRVDTNPPSVEAINVKKQPIPSIVPKTKQDYIDLTINLTAKWNSTTSCLELWRTSGWRHKIRKKKLGKVPIDLTKMQLGVYQPVHGDWLPMTINGDWR